MFNLEGAFDNKPISNYSLTPERCGNDFKSIISERVCNWMEFISASCEIAFRSIPQNTSDDNLRLVQVMVWCHQATRHYLDQCSPRSMLPYGVARSQSVKGMLLPNQL